MILTNSEQMVNKGKKHAFCLFLICLLFYVPDVFGVGGKYENKAIAEVVGLLSKKQITPNQDGELALGSICPGRFLVVESDKKGQINHVGVKLFDRQIMNDHPSPLYLFVERYLLWVLLTKDENLINQRIKEDRVGIRFGQSMTPGIYGNLYSSLMEIRPEQSFIITTDNSKYSVTWLEEHRTVLSVSFPIQYELIWGINKKEAEVKFKDDLMAYIANAPKYPSDNLPNDLIETENGLYRSAGDFYGLEEISSNRYYRQKKNHDYALVYDPDYPAESATNLFTTYPDPQIQIQITQRMYGNKRENYKVSLAVFLAFCRANGCVAFVGVERISKRQLEGSVVLVNRSLGYNHVLYFTIDNGIWKEQGQSPVVAQLYAFVPMHNVNSLYGKKNHK